MAMRERIKTTPAPEIVEYLVKARLTFLERDFSLLMWINKAHAVMLVKQRIVAQETGATILNGLLEMDKEGTENFTVDPSLEDVYLNMEHTFIKKVGVDVGGRLHTGRSRNDMYAAMVRMALRESFLDLLEYVFQARQAILDKASDHFDTVMPGYTHLQPAQPTTLGHYLASVAIALERDGDRLLEVYPRLNLNPLGAGAFAGTGFPINREMTAQFLGFDGLIESTLDSVASRDYISELLANLAITGVTFSRLAQDLHLWCSDEWGIMEVADEVAITSSIMPQKKNPFTFEHIKGKAGHLLGALVDTLSVQKNVNFMHCIDLSTEAVFPLWEALRQAEAISQLTKRTILGLQVKKELMCHRATEDFSTATELTDFLVREKDIPFRISHAIVGNVVVVALERGLRFDQITSKLLDQVAQDVTGQPLGLTDSQLSQVLDPALNLESKKASGSPSPSETQRLIGRARKCLEGQRLTVQEWRGQIKQAQQHLEQAVTSLV